MQIDSDIIIAMVSIFIAGVGGGLFYQTGSIIPYAPMFTVGILVGTTSLYGLHLRLNSKQEILEDFA